jgi:hypothetical protein
MVMKKIQKTLVISTSRPFHASAHHRSSSTGRAPRTPVPPRRSPSTAAQTQTLLPRRPLPIMRNLFPSPAAPPPIKLQSAMLMSRLPGQPPGVPSH